MAPERLTKRRIDSLRYLHGPESKKAHYVADHEVRRLYVRVFPSNRKSFVIRYRTAGRKRNFTLGAYGTLTLDQARKEARWAMTWRKQEPEVPDTWFGPGIRLLLLAFIGLSLGCQGSSRCGAAGLVAECPCVGGSSGVQTCQPDGSFSPCECLADPYTEVANGIVSDFALRRRTSEATGNLRAIENSSIAYFASANRFPSSSGGLHPPAPSSRNGACVPLPTYDWDSSPWQALQFQVREDPYYFHYQYDSHGEGDHAQYTASAFGDLDCDGHFSTFVRFGKVENHEVVPSPGVFIVDEIE